MSGHPGIVHFLESNGYTNVKILKDGRIACIQKFLFTAGIICGTTDRMWSMYDERWCYHDIKSAIASLDKWDGTGDPEGWHRHLPSSRRRKDSDPLKEYIDP